MMVDEELAKRINPIHNMIKALNNEKNNDKFSKIVLYDK